MIRTSESMTLTMDLIYGHYLRKSVFFQRHQREITRLSLIHFPRMKDSVKTGI